MHQLLCIVALIMCISASLANAAESPMRMTGVGDVVRAATPPGTLDDPQPDTLRYDDGVISTFYEHPGHFAAVRFTAPAAFELRSIYFAANNPTASTAPCSLFVCADDNGVPGTVLSTRRRIGLTHYGSLAAPVWNDINLLEPVAFNAGLDFWIMIGPIPGGSQGEGWHVLLDGGAGPGERSLFRSDRNLPWESAPDWLIRCGGEAGDYVDLAVESAIYQPYHSNQRFFGMIHPEFDMGGYVWNWGTQPINIVMAGFSIYYAGDAIYSESMAGPGSLLPHTSFLVTYPIYPWEFEIEEEGEYLISVGVSQAGDINPDNDTACVRIFLSDDPAWYRYDDNLDADRYVRNQEGNGWGVSFRPAFYPAAVESLRINVGGSGNGQLQILRNTQDGIPSEIVWSGTPDLMPGSNTVPVIPPVSLYDGMSFTAAFIYSTISLGQDESIPIAAANEMMGAVGWKYENEWIPDRTGNWMIQAFVDTTSIIAPYPVLAVNPADSMMFSEVDTTGSIQQTLDLWLYNRGGEGSLTISEFVFDLFNDSNAFTASPAELTILPGDSQRVEIRFDPSDVVLYLGTLTINNSSVNNPAKSLFLEGWGAPYNASPLPASPLPSAFALSQNFPNPFNPTTEIRFELPRESFTQLTVYNLLGQEVALLVSETLAAGVYRHSFDASNLPAGLYFYRLEAGSFSDVRKMMLLK